MTSAIMRSERPALLPPRLRRGLRRLGLRAQGSAQLAAGLALALALATYDASDPAANVASGGATSNVLGAGGAWIADWLLRGFGAAAAAAALAPIAWGCRGLKLKRTRRTALRLAALALALPCLAMGLAALQGVAGWPLREGPGGFVGSVLLHHAGLLTGGAAWLSAAAALGLGLLLAAWAFGFDLEDWAWVGAGTVAAGRGLRRLARAAPLPPVGLPGQARRTEAPQRTRRRTAPALRQHEAGADGPAPPADAEEAPPVPPVPPPPEQPARRRKRGPALQQRSLPLDDGYMAPPVELLQLPPPDAERGMPDEETLERNAALLMSVLEDFGIGGEVVATRPGPVVTLYEFEPQAGIKSSRVIGLADDIARYMSAVSVRVAVVPGRTVIGIEMPNRIRQTVFLRELIETDAYERAGADLPLILGKDIGGGPRIARLERMPHLLIAGTTGSGKSVAINTMILSLLYRLAPERCRLIMVDPKMLELSVYEGIPHLLAPVVTDPRKAVTALKWTVREMENRYRAMSALGVRNIGGYNARLAEALKQGETLTRRVQTGYDPETGAPEFEDQPLDMRPLPFIVVVIDELADLMLVARNDIETAIQRLAQMARAAGIHLLMATQRPSVDVITGTIKANFPTRISFQVTSKIDSRTILGEGGAEQLLGQGDMLFMAGGGRIARIHGPFVSDEEVEEIVAHLKAQGAPDYLDAITEDEDVASGIPGFEKAEGETGEDDLYDRAVAFVARERKVSVSLIQRHLRIGYNRAARIVEEMEAQGVVSGPNHQNKREVLAGAQDA